MNFIADLFNALLFLFGFNAALLLSYGLLRLVYRLFGWTWTDTWD